MTQTTNFAMSLASCLSSKQDTGDLVRRRAELGPELCPDHVQDQQPYAIANPPLHLLHDLGDDPLTQHVGPAGLLRPGKHESPAGAQRVRHSWPHIWRCMR